MEAKNSPFLSNTFQEIWKKHFLPKESIKTFKYINGVNFYKGSNSIFFNAGKNLTKGNRYSIKNYDDYKNKTFVIYDVLQTLNKQDHDSPKHLGILKSIQYPGFLIQLDKFENIDDYLLRTFSKNTRMKMRKFTKRLDACFNISTRMFYGSISMQEYDDVFKNFMILLQKRYSEKQILYNNMQPSEWNFYKEVAYPLILEKKASLFVIYNNKTPIAITYNYHTENSLIDAITVFDIDYSKFNIGYVNNLKLLNWCFDNGLKVLDFSKGYFDYKKRMSTLKYNFEYHILYDKKSVFSALKAYLFFCFFEFKAYLRKKDINTKINKITYKLKKGKPNEQNEKVKISTLNDIPNSINLIRIDVFESEKYSHLIRYLFDFLYLSVKSYNEIEVYEHKDEQKTYILKSNSHIQQIKFL